MFDPRVEGLVVESEKVASDIGANYVKSGLVPVCFPAAFAVDAEKSMFTADGAQNPNALKEAPSLLALKWDGVPRLSEWVSSAKASPHEQQQVREWLAELQSDLFASKVSPQQSEIPDRSLVGLHRSALKSMQQRLKALADWLRSVLQ